MTPAVRAADDADEATAGSPTEAGAAALAEPWWRTRRSRRVASTVLLGAVIAVLAWPIDPRPPLVILSGDDSWAAALSLAHSQGLEFGRDIVFNYGPLGFLVTPSGLVTDDASRMMLALRLPLLVALCSVVVAGFRWMGLRIGWAALAAVAVALPVAAALEPAPMLTVLTTVTMTVLLLRPPSARTQTIVTVAFGVVASAALLGKVSEGIAVAAIAGLGLTGLAWVTGGGWLGVARRAWVYGLALLASLLVWWTASGQVVGALPGYVRGGWEVSFGFAGAMGGEWAPPWEYAAAAACVAVLGGVWWLATAGRPVASRVVVGAVLALSVAFFFKAGFVRHDSHSQEFFGAMVILPLGLAGRARRWLRLTAVAAMLLVLALVLHAAGGWGPLLVGKHVHDAGKTMLWVVSSEAAHSSNERFRRLPDVPESMMDRIAGDTVHIEPVNAGLLWMYEGTDDAFVWRPVPTLQSYNNYTPYLDERAAAFLRSDEAPRFVLWRNIPIDNRIQRFDGPAYQLELACWYRPVDTGNAWTLLERRSSSACGAPEDGPTTTGTAGTGVDVPPAGPDDIVVGEFSGPGVSASTSARGLVWKPEVTEVEVGDGVWHRWVPGTAGQPHVLRMPDCLAGESPTGVGNLDLRDVDRVRFAGMDPGTEVTLRTQVIPYQCGR